MWRVCVSEELTSGEVHVVRISDDADGPREALVYMDERGTPRCFVNRCRHLPIPLDAGSREFLDRKRRYLVCNTHGAMYRLSDGVCERGPCVGERLEALPLVEQEGDLYVDA